MRIPLIIFLASWLLFLFAIVHHSTDSFEPAVFSGLAPYYLASLVSLCVLFVSWQGDLVPLAIISFFYEACIVALPYLKYPFLYGNVYDTMHHYAVTEQIMNTGHLPYGDQYFGFTTFHATAVSTSLLTGLPLEIAFKLVLFLLAPLFQLASFSVSLQILRKQSTRKLAILTGMISYVPVSGAGPGMTAAFFLMLIMILVLSYWSQSAETTEKAYLFPIVLLGLAIVMTHHSTAFFAIFGLIATGLLLNLLKDSLKSLGNASQGLILLGLISLGFGYLWWTYYSGFTDLLRFIASVVEQQSVGFQTTIGRGPAYYGPTVWLYRTVIIYAQRGQVWVWSGLGLLVSLLLLSGRVKWRMVDTESHAVVFVYAMLFLGLWALFLFVPYFVIGPERFSGTAFLLAPPIMAMGIEALYKFCSKIAVLLNRSKLPVHALPRAVFAFSLLVLIFTEFSSQLFLGGLSAASSQYQYSQIVFMGSHLPAETQILSNVAITHQLQAYTPSLDTSNFAKHSSIDALNAVYAGKTLPIFANQALIVFNRIGPAGGMFEAVAYYPNDTWIGPASSELLAYRGTSLLYNSGEAFIVLGNVIG